MSSAKPLKKAHKAVPGGTLMVRMDPQSKACLVEAARLRQISVSDHVRTVTVAQARREVAAARERVISLAPEEQLAFWKALTRKLPRRILPVAALAWLGVDRASQGRGLGRLLLAQALRDCWEAGKTFAFVAVILDCMSDAAKAFYRHWDFRELPGHRCRLFLSTRLLEALMEKP